MPSFKVPSPVLLALLLLAGMILWRFVFTDRYPDNPTYAGTVDLDRYAGRWYQVVEAESGNAWLFRLVERASRQCVGVRVDYTVAGDRILLRNTCNDGGFDGREVVITGVARAVDARNTKFKVRFDPWYLAPFAFDYWIVDLDPDYEIAVLGAPDSKGITILSRRRLPDPARLRRAMEVATDLGYDLARTTRTPQPPGAP